MKVFVVLLLALAKSTDAWATMPCVGRSSLTLRLADGSFEPSSTPSSFREAEVLGLRLMQEGKFEDALNAFKNGMKLPGSRADVVRTKLLSGPSPVGGAFGGLESSRILSLDEFELQAAHYNMACAYARLGNAAESCANLRLAFENGFDNFATVRGDPDLKAIQKSIEYEDLMEKYDSKKGFNPFGLFK